MLFSLARQVSLLALTASLALGAAPALAQKAPAPNADDKQIIGLADKNAPTLAANALKIWTFAEIGYHETQSSALLQATLKDAGFTVKSGVAGMPTAFVASYRTGPGPVIALIGEFDSLPGLAQEAVPTRAPIKGQRAGHGCGHNLFGAASVGAAITVRQWMDANHIKGEIRVYGAPAEEAGAGKVFMVRDGLFADVDAALHWHPADINTASQQRSLAVVGMRFQFHGVASHAAASPEKGRSALDGVEVMDVAVNFLREHVPQETRIHYVIKKGGEAPNVVPDFAESEYYIRSPSAAELAGIVDRVKKAAEGAAIATGTRYEAILDSGVYDLLPNDVLGHIADRNLHALGVPAYDATQAAFAKTLSASLDTKTFTPGSEVAVEAYHSGDLDYGSTDVGDISYVVPTVGIQTATWVPGTSAHSWQAVAASGMTIGTDGAVRAAKVLAMTAADLFRDPAQIKAAKAELDRRRGAGFQYKALLGDVKPDLNYGED